MRRMLNPVTVVWQWQRLQPFAAISSMPTHPPSAPLVLQPPPFLDRQIDGVKHTSGSRWKWMWVVRFVNRHRVCSSPTVICFTLSHRCRSVVLCLLFQLFSLICFSSNLTRLCLHWTTLNALLLLASFYYWSHFSRMWMWIKSGTAWMSSK